MVPRTQVLVPSEQSLRIVAFFPFFVTPDVFAGTDPGSRLATAGVDSTAPCSGSEIASGGAGSPANESGSGVDEYKRSSMAHTGRSR